MKVFTFVIFCSIMLIISTKTVDQGPSSVDIVYCPDGLSVCPTGNTCCIAVNNNYSCCPLDKAVCCADRIHCCPEHYQCDLIFFKCDRKLHTTILQMNSTSKKI